MAADYLSKWTPAGGADFPFSGVYALNADAVTDSGVERRIPASDTVGDGEFGSRGLAAPRKVAIEGTIHAASPSAVRAALDALSAAFATRDVGKLYIHSDRYLLCRVAGFSCDPENGLSFRTWRASFTASEYPFWIAAGAEWSAAAAGGTIAVPAMGSTDTAVRLEIAVSATGAPAGSIEIAHQFGTAILRPSATGLYIVDGAAGTVTRDGADAIADFEGNFPRLIKTAHNLVLTTLSSAAYSGATAYARARYESL